ncbi:MAG: PPC domain-containing protein [Polyangiales bacterium]
MAKWFWACGASWLLACGSASSPERGEPSDGGTLHDASEARATDAGHTPDADDTSDAGDTPDAASTPDARPPGTGLADAFEAPSNLSFETARPITAEDIWQRVVNDTQVDYYSFEAKAGLFYVLTTDVSSFSPDNVVTVYDADRRVLAENDHGSRYPNDHVDARLVFRPEQTGRYYVTVEDRISPTSSSDGRYVPPLIYHFTVREVTADTPSYTLVQDSETPTTLELMDDAATHARVVTLLGVLNAGEEQTFTLHGMADTALIGTLVPSGRQGESSTALATTVRVTSDSDQHLLAVIAQTAGQSSIHPPVDDGTYTIRVKAGDTVGSNDFYVLDLALLHDNPQERAEAANNRLEDAELVTLSNVQYRRGLLLSRLPNGDVDHYRFDANKGEHIIVGCEGESSGSGVRGLQAELLDAPSHSLIKAREPQTERLLIDNFEVQLTGTHYLKLTSDTPPPKNADDDQVEPWVRCAIIVGP